MRAAASHLIAALGFAALVAAGDVPAQSVAKPFTHTIRPRQIAEECFRLSAGESIGYAFESTAPVDFNIHYHRGKEIEYPVKVDQAGKADDRFTASVSDEFCLMWTNRTLQMVTVKGELRP